MNKSFGVIILSVMSVVSGYATVGMPKYELSFKQYKNTQVPKEQRNKFHRFYNHKLDKQLIRKDENRAAFNKHNAKVRCQGMIRIEKQHPATFRAIADKITRKETPKSTKNKIERYINREGILEEFIAYTKRKEENVWGYTKKYTREAWEKMRSGVVSTYSNLTKPSTKKPNGKKTQSRRKRGRKNKKSGLMTA